ncbi:hypothetical protein NPIL_21661, partial [Nephila pilipes]
MNNKNGLIEKLRKSLTKRIFAMYGISADPKIYILGRHPEGSFIRKLFQIFNMAKYMALLAFCVLLIT